MRRISIILLAASLLAGPALAQQGGLKVGGKLNNNTNVDNALNLGLGKGNTATQRIGTITGNVDVGGDLTNTTRVKNALNLALGKDNKACQEIGAIGETACK